VAGAGSGGAAAKGAVAGVYVGAELVVSAEPVQYLPEGHPLLRVEGGEEIVAVFLSHPADLLEAFVAGRSEVQRVVAPVLRVAPAFE